MSDYHGSIRESKKYDEDTFRLLHEYYHALKVPVRFERASMNEDKLQATDFWIVEWPFSELYRQRHRLQVRLRNDKWKEMYLKDFTISGPHRKGDGWEESERTEWYKMQKYYVSRYLYGMRGDEHTVAGFRLLDMDLFERKGMFHRGKEKIKDNGRQKFHTYEWRDMPKGFILYEYPPRN